MSLLQTLQCSGGPATPLQPLSGQICTSVHRGRTLKALTDQNWLKLDSG